MYLRYFKICHQRIIIINIVCLSCFYFYDKCFVIIELCFIFIFIVKYVLLMFVIYFAVIFIIYLLVLTNANYIFAENMIIIK
ncbi:hypothetical protein BTW28_19415 [Citrobacter freundii]|nr:hypothetical protein BTW28_19415 [Citrobacter freundii]